MSFDVKKAYETIWRHGILRSLYYAGLRGKLSLFIQHFFRNMIFKIQIGWETSTIHTLEQGVPQGCVLSYTLFSLAINGVLSVIPGNIGASLYVDDLFVYCRGSYLPSMEGR